MSTHGGANRRDSVKNKDKQALSALTTSPELLRQPPISLLVLDRALDPLPGGAANQTAAQSAAAVPKRFLDQLRPGGRSWQSAATPFLTSGRRWRFGPSLAPCTTILALHEPERECGGGARLYRKALELDPKMAGIHYNIGYIFHDQKKLTDAVAFYRKAIELNPEDRQIPHGIGTGVARPEKSRRGGRVPPESH